MKHRILVLGAGYSGVLTAQRLSRGLAGVDITLVNADERFAERTRMHQMAAGQQLADMRLRDLVAGRGINLVIDRVTGIDATSEVVDLASGQQLRYDTLLYALGSDSPHVDGFSVATPSHARKLRDRVAASPGVRIGVIGAGLTGIETVTELAESYPRARVSLLCDRPPGYWLSAKAQRHIAAAFDRLGVGVHAVQVDRTVPGAVETVDGRSIPVDVPVWTVGFAVPPLAREAGLEVDGDGRIRVDSTMRSVSHSNVYAVGDAAVAEVDGKAVRMACGTGSLMAMQAAKAITAKLTGRTPGRFYFRYFAQQISLGRHDGFVQFTRADDSPSRFGFGGRGAAWFKESIFKALRPLLRYRGLTRRREVHSVTSDRAVVS